MYDDYRREDELTLEGVDGEENDTLVFDETETADGNNFSEELNGSEAPAPAASGEVIQKVNRGGVVGGRRNSIGQMMDADVVLVIDCTGSMGPLLGKVKRLALNFHNALRSILGNKSRIVRKLRFKVIAYRDYYYDWEDPDHPPMLISDFFTLPDEEEAFAEFVNNLEAAGGEDEPESALEALHLAFNSDWYADPAVSKRRQIIALFTDASAHQLNDPKRYVAAEHNGEYPEEGMPDTLEALEAEYLSPDVFPADENGIIRGHRLLLFAPENMYPWNIVSKWSAATCESMMPKEGLEELSTETVVNLIGGSF